MPLTSSGDASSPKGGCDAFVAFFHTFGKAVEPTGDDGVAHTFLRRGVAATYRPTSEFGIITPNWLPRRVRLSLNFQRLTVFRPSTLDLVLTKMMRGDENDLADIRFLLQQETIFADQLRAAFTRARVPDVPEIRDLFQAAQPKVLALAKPH